MQFPVTIGLHRSLFLAGAVVIVHALALLVIWLPEWASTTRILGCTLVFLSAVWSAMRWRSHGIVLRLTSDGRLECGFPGNDEFLPAELTSAATVHPWLIVIHARTVGQRMTVVALPDSGRAEDLRQLRVWLRWRADFKTDAGLEE